MHNAQHVNLQRFTYFKGNKEDIACLLVSGLGSKNPTFRPLCSHLQKPLKICSTKVDILILHFTSWLSCSLRWPNTVFARAFADAIQHVHKDFKKQTFHQ